MKEQDKLHMQGAYQAKEEGHLKTGGDAEIGHAKRRHKNKYKFKSK